MNFAVVDDLIVLRTAVGSTVARKACEGIRPVEFLDSTTLREEPGC
jgi:hypothetical protein